MRNLHLAMAMALLASTPAISSSIYPNVIIQSEPKSLPKQKPLLPLHQVIVNTSYTRQSRNRRQRRARK